MSNSRRRSLNPGNLLVLFGVVLLVVSFRQPTWSAARTARVEERAEILTGWLLEAAVAADPEDLTVPGVRLGIAQAVAKRCRAEDMPLDHFLAAREGDLERPPTADTLAPSPLPGLAFRGKHYMFQVLRAQPETETTAPEDAFRPPWELPDVVPLGGPDRKLPPLEVYAWPVNRRVGPAHTVFFASEDGLTAYTRNLQAAYNGTRKTPRVGCARRRDPENATRNGWYRGDDDERWRDRLAVEEVPDGAADGDTDGEAAEDTTKDR